MIINGSIGQKLTNEIAPSRGGGSCLLGRRDRSRL